MPTNAGGLGCNPSELITNKLHRSILQEANSHEEVQTTDMDSSKGLYWAQCGPTAAHVEEKMRRELCGKLPPEIWDPGLSKELP